MGACVSGGLSEGEKAAKKRNNEIDYELQQDRKRLRQEVKLLLLGPGESGKSTIFKQMKIISMAGGFTREELMAYKHVIYGNCVTQMKVIVHAASKLGIEMASEDNMERAERLAKLPAGGDSFTSQVAQDIAALWADAGIRAAYEQRDKTYQLNDSASYFFDNIGRFEQADYCPTERDVLRARIRSVGIDEAQFEFDDMAFCMVDVGGQRSERRKWIHCFDCVTAVIFCVALSEYDQTLREDDSQNRTKESLLLFDEICNSPWFAETAFILFLNKVDLFKEKIKKVDLKGTFPSYNGGANFEAASQFIRSRFLEVNTSPHVIYTHFTCAIDTQNIEFVFKAVRETILKTIIDNIF
ncbi:guanine nucleotide-binding protein alpha-5 subunit, putative [Acanthamoeba castellanii str. Neff]|uniref:Guanine nucleotide-binding protein alpha-5 subunit, putative n=2 Tax=Acanthamoeba castellanii (strain ATCC 30010 / Neff) TaxID=1257118 RepID=L8HLC2_ACACF|nr:guanine nucleotide-binding protein alpha-5 subunit, putative [Acanthamoeba castellanii str. Neff]ELR25473.1 guanine nucleotide-binding protein alpha-5 subunit, putative [Acanthamoeba castellanii str. Neff]